MDAVFYEDNFPSLLLFCGILINSKTRELEKINKNEKFRTLNMMLLSFF
jgi:hypothetical protein